MKKTIISRLRALGYAVHSSVPNDGGGLLVRPIGRAQCVSCGEPHLYTLYEIVLEEMVATDRSDGAIFMEWLARRINSLGTFCNSCGSFSKEECSEAMGHFGSRLGGTRCLDEVVSMMETVVGEFATLSLEQLSVRAKRLEAQLETVRCAIAARKGYRD